MIKNHTKAIKVINVILIAVYITIFLLMLGPLNKLYENSVPTRLQEVMDNQFFLIKWNKVIKVHEEDIILRLSGIESDISIQSNSQLIINFGFIPGSKCIADNYKLLNSSKSDFDKTHSIVENLELMRIYFLLFIGYIVLTILWTGVTISIFVEEIKKKMKRNKTKRENIRRRREERRAELEDELRRL